VRGPAGEYMLIYADREAPDILCRRRGVLSVRAGPGVPPSPTSRHYSSSGKSAFSFRARGRRRRASGPVGPAARPRRALVPSGMRCYSGYRDVNIKRVRRILMAPIDSSRVKQRDGRKGRDD